MKQKIKQLIKDYIAFNPNALQSDDPVTILPKDIVTDSLYIYKPQKPTELKKCIIALLEQNIYDLNCIDTSEIKTMNNLFNVIQSKFHELTEEQWKQIDISYWDVSNVTNFSGMFMNCKYFNCDISEWDVSKGTDFSFMFDECKEFNCDLSRWNVSKGKDFQYMFNGCTQFNQDLSNWKVGKGETFENMFCNCENFNSDLSGWNVSNGKIFSNMFSGCKTFNSDLSRWNLCKGERFVYMFKNCDMINFDLSKWNINNTGWVSSLIAESPFASKYKLVYTFIPIDSKNIK